MDDCLVNLRAINNTAAPMVSASPSRSLAKARQLLRDDECLAYINANLEGVLSVKALSQVANFSAFHFHR